ncbi:hypothetical protein Tco_0883628, partial [Tanacetum coccineum]
LEEKPAEKLKKAKKPDKKSITIPTAGVAIRDTPSVPISKKKVHAKGDKGKGMELLFNAALLEAAQVKEALQKSKKDSHMLHASGSGDRVGSQPKVLDESQDKTTGTDEGSDSEDDDNNDDMSKGDDNDADSDGKSDNDASDNEMTDSDEEENHNLTLKDDAERKKEGKGDVEMIDADKDVSQERSYKQVVDDAHVTLTTTQKTEGSMQSSSVSSDFASKFLNLDNVPPTDNEVASMMNVKVHQEESSTLAPPFLTVHILPKEISDFATLVIQSTINESLKNVFLAKSSSQPQSTYEAATSLTEFELKKILLDKLEKSKSWINQGLKKRRQKEAEPKKASKSKKSISSKGTKSQTKTSGKSVQAEEPVFETTDTEMPQDQGGDLGNIKDQLEEASKHDWFKKPERPPTPDLD